MSGFKALLEKHIHTAAESREFAVYTQARETVLAMLDAATPESAASDYWQQELAGFAYMLDASPLIIETLRHHTYHLTGLYEYFYRSHHAGAAKPFRQKLDALTKLDTAGVRVPEARALGGFGFEINGELYNLDTLKFYEVLIGLDRTGFLKDFRGATGEKKVVLEIGSGWGGFAYQFKTLFPNTTYVLVDFPQVLLFAAVYLQTLFPNARIYLGDGSPQSYVIDFSAYDFVFVPHYAWSALEQQHIDLAVNMASFQEMTDAQVRGYVSQLAAWGTPRLYSLNRDISPNNKEISGVTKIMAEFYSVEEVSVLPVPYHTLSLPSPSLVRTAKDLIKQILRRKPKRMAREYRHVRAILR